MMEQVPLVRRGSYPLRCIRSPGQSERLAPAFRTNRTSWCALFDVCSITCTHSGCFSYWTDFHWDSTFRVSFDTAWLSLVSPQTSCILSNPAVCSSPQHMPAAWTPRQCCSHHWKVVKTDLRKYFLSLFFHPLSLLLALFRSLSLSSATRQITASSLGRFFFLLHYKIWYYKEYCNKYCHISGSVICLRALPWHLCS